MGTRLGDRLIDLRRRAGLTQEEAAIQLEQFRKTSYYSDNYSITRSALANYEKGIRKPNMAKLRLLAEFYHADLMELTMLSSEEMDSEEYNSSYFRTLHEYQQITLQQEEENKNEKAKAEARRYRSDRVKNREEKTAITLPIITEKDIRIDSLQPSDFVLSYSSRREFIMLDKFRQLTPENRAKIEERIDMLLEMQKETTNNKK